MDPLHSKESPSQDTLKANVCDRFLAAERKKGLKAAEATLAVRVACRHLARVDH